MLIVKDPNKIIIAKKENKNKTRIFIDIDGVLADWLGKACETCGIDDNDPVVRKLLKDGSMLQDLKDYIKDEDEMWQKIEKEGSDWWRDLELLPWAKKLYNEMDKLGEVAFLTSNGNIAEHTNSASLAAKGKCGWVKKHFNTNSLIIAHDKHFCANDKAILIDDSPDKIEKFIDWGGRGFLWPNQYKLQDKDIDVEDFIKALSDIVEDIK